MIWDNFIVLMHDSDSSICVYVVSTNPMNVSIVCFPKYDPQQFPFVFGIKLLLSWRIRSLMNTYIQTQQSNPTISLCKYLSEHPVFIHEGSELEVTIKDWWR